MCMWMTSNLLVVMSIYCRRRKEVLVLKVQKNVLGRVSLVIIIEIHLEKNKRGISNVTWTCLERYLKYACEKPKHVLIVNGNGTGNYGVPKVDEKRLKTDMVPYASAVKAQYITMT